MDIEIYLDYAIVKVNEVKVFHELRWYHAKVLRP